ncbi:hypothetical protein ANANG_G00294820 [Anguilla anguilla]|uniref:Uncharacterized protein n=1 Tax=Anguilla anguilla TaxID=7936 RepID=A0A9D3RJV7_ANGAN|nr:hypothetical protein ANANG_G00294820 [Anguilla anguilla]
MVQPTQQLKQHPSPPAYVAPPMMLQSSQLLGGALDPLPHFSQPVMHLSQQHDDPAPPAPSHLDSHPPAIVPVDTHPFLNQHAALPTPALHNAMPQQPSRPTHRAAPLPPKVAQQQLLQQPEPQPHHHHQPPQLLTTPALLEDDEEPAGMPVSQVPLYMQHLQSRPALSAPILQPAQALQEPRPHAAPAPTPQGPAPQTQTQQHKASAPQMLPQQQQQQPPPRGSTNPNRTAQDTQGKVSPPSWPSTSPPADRPPHNLQPAKKPEQRGPQAHGGMKEEKLPVIQGDPFSPALRQEPQKHLDGKPGQPASGLQRLDLKPLESLRPAIRASESSAPPHPAPDKEKFKQEPKTPTAPKKVQDVKLKNMGSWASLAQRSRRRPPPRSSRRATASSSSAGSRARRRSARRP